MCQKSVQVLSRALSCEDEEFACKCSQISTKIIAGSVVKAAVANRLVLPSARVTQVLVSLGGGRGPHMPGVLLAAPQYCLSLDRLRNKPSREKAPAAAVTNPMALIARLACKGGKQNTGWQRDEHFLLQAR